MYGREERCLLGLVVRPKGESPLEKPRCRLKNNIKVDLQEVKWEVMDWMDKNQERESWQALLNAVMNFGFP